MSDIEKKITDHNHDKYIATSEFNTLAADDFNVRLAQANVITKTDFDAKLQNLSKKITLNRSKYLLVENELKKLKIFDIFYFRGKSHFEEDDTQNYLVFHCVYKYFKRAIDSTSNNTYAHYWQSKGLSNEKLNAPGTNSNNDQAPLIQYDNTRISLQFSGDCFKQNKFTYNHGRGVNICIVYRLSPHTASTDSPIKSGFFGAIKLIKNCDKDENQYSGYGISFDSRVIFTHPDGSYGVNAIIFGCGMSSSGHSNNRGDTILILGRSLIQKLHGKTLYAEKVYPTNFTVANKTFVLSLHYNGNYSYLFVNGVEQTTFKAKDSEIKPYPLCLGHITKDFSSTNAQKTGLYRHVYNFSVDYKAIGNDEILKFTGI